MLAACMCLGLGGSVAVAADKPNVILIVCDDLNDGQLTRPELKAYRTETEDKK